ncbi:MAG: penicillin-binding protein 2 [Patescibacteria group bacterium]|nr:penicillin-binding protein 2 [Patescibacteria group bacterium]
MAVSNRGASGSARFRARTRLLAAAFIVLALICIGRLYYVQVMEGAAYTAKADREFMTPSNPLFARGTIYMTTKDGAEIAAATTESGVSLALEPPLISDPEALFNTLNAITPLQKSTFLTDATRSDTQYVVVADHLSTSTGALIEAANATGTLVAEDAWRYYPGGSLAAETIGFVGYDGNTLNGRYGLERQYETTLERQGGDLYTNFFVELFAGVKNILSGNEEGDIITTIEPNVQEELERELVLYDQEWHPQFDGGIIMDPQTGAIYAMAQTPTFDLNNYGAVTDQSLYSNLLVQNVYEMGSLIKSLTMAAGIDTGAVTATTTYDDTPCITVDTAQICNFDHRGRGVIPMQQVLSQSLNVGASFVATQLGPARMRNYFENKFDLGTPTGIDLPTEAKGLIDNLNTNNQLYFDEASFGQGIAMTPIETIRALDSIANGGYLVTPHLVSAIRTSSGISVPLSWPTGPQIISTTTSQILSQMLTNVVDTQAEDDIVKLDHWSIAAKTGTAQIADPVHGGYIPNVYLHSYFGYFPSYDPRFIIFLLAYEPVGAPYSAETWGGIFHDLSTYLINYYNIPPDR